MGFATKSRYQPVRGTWKSDEQVAQICCQALWVGTWSWDAFWCWAYINSNTDSTACRSGRWSICCGNLQGTWNRPSSTQASLYNLWILSSLLSYVLQYFKLKKMTKEQIAIFIAEHKWDYQREFWNSTYDCFLSVVHCSFWFCCCSPRNLALHRLDFFNFKSGWSCYVGPWYVDVFISENSTISANANLDLEKRQHWFLEKKRKVL